MTNGPCNIELCPRHYGQPGCPLEDALRNPTSTDPQKDDRGDYVRQYRRCADFKKLKKQFPDVFQQAGF